MEQWRFIDEILRPFCKLLDENIAFLLPVMNSDNKVFAVNIGYKDNNVETLNIDDDSLMTIAKEVINYI